MSQKQMVLTDTDKKLLEEIQHDLPLVSRPFNSYAEKLGRTESDVIERLQELQQQQVIRNFSAILHAPALNYQSALVAASVPEAQVERFAQQINAHPGVSHNYLREDVYNIWFTLTLPKHQVHQQVVGELLNGQHPFLVLPAIKTYKIGVHFRFGSDQYDHAHAQEQRGDSVMDIDEDDKILIRNIQQFIPLTSEPWKQIASVSGTTEEVVFEKLNHYKTFGALKRISATLRHRNIGISANGMVCLKADPTKLDQIGMQIAAHRQVTHCYQRPVSAAWPYSLYAMVHAKESDACRQVAASIAESTECQEYKVLFSVQEFKKERVKYFFD